MVLGAMSGVFASSDSPDNFVGLDSPYAEDLLRGPEQFEELIINAISQDNCSKLEAIMNRYHKKYGNYDIANKTLTIPTVLEYTYSKFSDEGPHTSTFLHYACELHYHDIVKFLISIGADANILNDTGNGPVYCASESGDLELMEILFKQGKANLNCADISDWTPLHAAVGNGRLDMVRFLVSNKVNLHTKTDDGRTALTLAFFEHESLDMVKCLIPDVQSEIEFLAMIETQIPSQFWKLRQEIITKVSDLFKASPMKDEAFQVINLIQNLEIKKLEQMFFFSLQFCIFAMFAL